MNRKILLLLMLLISLGFAEEYAFTQTIFHVDVSESAKIDSFTASPPNVYNNQEVTFSITVENNGSLQTNVQPTLYIYNSTGYPNPVHTIAFSLQALGAGSTAIFTQSWDVGSASIDTYTAVAVLNFSGTNQTSKNASFSVIVSLLDLETGGGVKKTPAPPQISPVIPSPNKINPLFFPVLEEVIAGDTISGKVVLSNPTGLDFYNIEGDVRGIPANFISMFPSSVDLKSGEKKTVQFMISTPPGLLPGDYVVNLEFENNDMKVLRPFLLRIKSKPEVISQRPVVERKVSLDLDKKVVEVRLVVKNGENSVQEFILTEEIPPELAPGVSFARFDVPPTEILGEHKARWSMELDSYEVTIIDYTIPYSTEDFGPYIYWSAEEEVAIYKENTVFLQNITIPPLIVGKRNEVSLFLDAFVVDPMQISANLLVPNGWKVLPNVTAVSTPVSGVYYVTFIVEPQVHEEGTYPGAIVLSYDDKRFVQPQAFSVRFAEPMKAEMNIQFLIGAVAIAGFLGFFVTWRLVKSHKDRKDYGEEAIDEIKRLRGSM